METINLITDRTSADVLEAKKEIQKVQMGQAPSEAYLAGLKGCYNATDLNRVETAVSLLAERFQNAGYLVQVDTKTDWEKTDFFDTAQLARYLDNVETLRAILTVFTTTPQTPDSYNPYTKANDIETILRDVDRLEHNMEHTIDLGWALGKAHIGLYGGIV